MKTYLVEVKDINYIVRAKSKLDAAIIVENTYNCSFIYMEYVTRLPKKGVILRVIV